MPGLDTIKVLIVDDNEQMRMLIRSMLRAVGIPKVFEAANVEEGVEVLRNAGADIVLLDFAMLPANGIEFVRRVRKITGSPNPFVPIIMMTCHSQRVHVAAARDAGVNSFLAKPISGRTLVEHILAAASDSRPFVRADTYFGPDRRRSTAADYAGPFRRSTDKNAPTEDLDLDDGFSSRPAAARA